jgi:autotransporter-associated beta strand protein
MAAPVVHTWTGGGGNQLWSNAGNWDAAGVPANHAGGTTVQFGAGTTSTMDIAGLTVDLVHFTGAGNTINGSAGKVLSLRGSIAGNNVVSDAAGNTLAATLPLALTGGSTIFVLSDPGLLTMAGPISGTTAGLRVFGTGASGATLSGANTYTTTTTVAQGTLHLNNSAADAAVVGTTLAVGGSGGAGATLVLDQSIEIADTTNVTVAADGTFDAGGHDETINNLTVGIGAVALGAGTLVLNGALTMTGGTVTGTGLLGLKGDASLTSSVAATATVASPVTLNGARTVAIADGPQATDAALGGVISDGAATGTLTKDGPGTLLLSAATANLYTGGTSVKDGVLLLDGAASAVIPAAGLLTIGDGAGAESSAIVRLGQLSEISNSASVEAERDGLLDLAGFSEGLTALTVDGGNVSVGAGGLTLGGAVTMVGGRIALGGAGALTANGLLSMAGGTITGTSTGGVRPTGDVQATSSAAGPATISAGVTLTANRTFTVTPGTAPELAVEGVIGDAGGGFGLTKAGAGTMVLAGTNSYSGTTTIGAGTLVANGAQAGPVAVGAGGRLAGTGTVGATTVAGTLHPSAPALKTGALTFAATGRLDVDVPSPAGVPKVVVTGAVTIDPAAALALHPAAGVALPAGTQLPLVDNDAADAVTGRFGNAPAGGVFTADGVPFTTSYAGGGGNDVEATVLAPTPPATPPVTTTPTPAPPAPPGAACVDRVAPVTTIAKATLTRTGLTVSGRTSDLRCGVKAKPALVSVAIARQAGTRCRWIGAKGLSSCTKVPAKALRRAKGVASYSITVKRALAPGRYVVVALARDAAGNVEKRSAKLVKTRRVR